MTMLEKVRSKFADILQRPVTLELEGKRHTFHNSADFEKLLRTRIDVSTGVLKNLSRRSEHELRQEHHRISEVHRQVMSAVLRVLESDESYTTLWDELDISVLPEDHHWQALLFALGDENHVPDDFRRVAIVNYLQYLSARREILENLCKEINHQATAEFSNQPHPSQSDITIRRVADITRLPHERMVRLALPENKDIQLQFGRLPVALRLESNILKIRDTSGTWHTLLPGRYLLGRSRECDITFFSTRADVADISRRHLQLELDSDGEVRVKDLSSRGTWLSRSLLPDNNKLSF
ncbi:MAG TPA: FHA domain-containing protein [Gammaproteobacteria bacterium]|nr:FHA domain-containing protein [Gammaproteobacteria bacterium]